MTETRSTRLFDSETEAILLVISLAACGGFGWLIDLVAGSDRVVADVLLFLGMPAAFYPLARRTWAAHLSPRRYWEGSLVGAAAVAAFRMLL